jgi:hypothetical protein
MISTSQRTQFVPIIKTIRLILFKEISAVYYEDQTEQLWTEFFKVKVRGTLSCRLILNR